MLEVSVDTLSFDFVVQNQDCINFILQGSEASLLPIRAHLDQPENTETCGKFPKMRVPPDIIIFFFGFS